VKNAGSEQDSDSQISIDLLLLLACSTNGRCFHLLSSIQAKKEGKGLTKKRELRKSCDII